MTQQATVRRVFDDGTAELAVRRDTACAECHSGGDCAECAQARQLTVRARNPVGAAVGDRVILQTGSGAVLAVAAAVYLLPIGLFFAGYALWRIWGGVIGALAALLLALALNRLVEKKGGLSYEITGFAER